MAPPFVQGTLRENDRRLQRFVYLAAFVTLAASVTNAVPLAGAMIVLTPLIPAVLSQRPAVPQVLVPTFLMLGFFAVSATLYETRALVSFGFFRRDGNVFVTYAPLLVLGLLHLDIDVFRIFRRFALWASVVNAVIFPVWLATGRTPLDHNPALFSSLFSAHNAGGGFLAMLSAMTLALLIHDKGWRWMWFIFLSLNMAGLVFSASRGSILALGLALILVPLPRALRGLAVAGMVIANISVVSWAYSVVDIESALAYDVFAADKAGVDTDSDMDGAISRADTLVNRLFDQWPSAIHHFLDSPLVGTGFGSFNDLGYATAGISGVLAWKTPDRGEYNSGHAHHTYFHLLAETGIVGLGLFLVSLLYLYRFIDRELPHGALRLSLLLAFWTAVISSMTEHRFFTPSQMLPFMLLLGLAIAARHTTLRPPRPDPRSDEPPVVPEDPGPPADEPPASREDGAAPSQPAGRAVVLPDPA